MKTFADLLESNKLFESSSFKDAEKILTKIHKFQLEIQDLQTILLDLYHKSGQVEVASKEKTKLEANIQKIFQKKKEIEEDLQKEKMQLQRSLVILDEYSDVEDFF